MHVVWLVCSIYPASTLTTISTLRSSAPWISLLSRFNTLATLQLKDYPHRAPNCLFSFFLADKKWSYSVAVTPTCIAVLSCQCSYF
ncbi:hypothetical protein K439DRAFT_1068711 [Ramaria rubella]|nr:hypothetical protein K439DRAFT_1068711 [Ramaria rubella]